MDKKNAPPEADPADFGPERTKVARHRFAEGETRIMRLDEILRQRSPEPAVAPAAAPASSTERAADPKAASAKLSAQEKQLLQSTEPAAHTVMVRREDLLAKAGERASAKKAAARATPAQQEFDASKTSAELHLPQPPAAAAPRRTPMAGARADMGAFGGDTRVFSLDKLAHGPVDKVASAPADARKTPPAPPSAPVVKSVATPAEGPSPPPMAVKAADAKRSAPAASRGDLTPPPTFLPAGSKATPTATDVTPPPMPPPRAEATAAKPPPAADPPPALRAEVTAAKPPPTAAPLAAPPAPVPDASRVAAAAAAGLTPTGSESEAKKASQIAVAAQTSTPTSRPEASQKRIANQVLVVFSCKGGAGATTLATNAAHAAAYDKHSACLVDLDLQLGDALAACGLPPRLSLAQTVQALGEGQGIGKTLLPSHASGVHVLSQVGNLNDLDKITPDSMSSLVAGLRLNFESVVIDGVRDFGDNELAVLDGADKVALVIVQEVLAIRRARWAYSILGKIGFEPEDIAVVVSRYNSQNDISLASVQTMFAGSSVVPVVNNAALATQALDRGVPLRELKADASITKSVVGTCEHLLYGTPPPAAPGALAHNMPAKRSFWQRIFGGRKEVSAS